MAFNAEASGNQFIEYTPNDTYKALNSALRSDKSFTIKDVGLSARTITVKTGISWKSWGENLFIAISPSRNGMSEISITSASKYGMVDWGKNQDNVNKVLSILFDELKHYSRVQPANAASAEDIPAQIKKLSDLKDAGILSNEEFQQKKQQLLAKM